MIVPTVPLVTAVVPPLELVSAVVMAALLPKPTELLAVTVMLFPSANTSVWVAPMLLLLPTEKELAPKIILGSPKAPELLPDTVLP